MRSFPWGELRTAFVCGRWRVTTEKLVLGPDLRKDQPVKWLTVTAMLKFPFQVFQAAFGAAVSMLLCFKAGLLTFWDKFSQR